MRLTDPGLLVIAKKNGKKTARLGLAISKKRVKSAVKRNLIKRLIRESFSKNQKKLVNWDVVVVTHRNLEKIKRVTISKNLEKHWQKIQQCKKP